jgi:hypothetical protein
MTHDVAVAVRGGPKKASTVLRISWEKAVSDPLPVRYLVRMTTVSFAYTTP